MSDTAIFIVVPLAGYALLWLLASAIFLVYCRFFGVPLTLADPLAMIRGVPPLLAVATVGACSLASFFLATRVVLAASTVSLRLESALLLGAVSLGATIVLDLLITVVVERLNILLFPVNLMYLLAWLAIVPGVLLGRA